MMNRLLVIAFLLFVSGCRSFERELPNVRLASQPFQNRQPVFVSPCIMIDNAPILGKTSIVRQFAVFDDTIVVVDSNACVVHAFKRGKSTDVDFVAPNRIWVSDIKKSIEIQLTKKKFDELSSSPLQQELKRNPANAYSNN